MIQQLQRAMALGYFDGVHLGHRDILCSAVDYAKKHGCESGVFTFRFDGVRTKGSDLLTREQSEERIRELGIRYYTCRRFDEFSHFTPEEFVCRLLRTEFRAAAVFCGANFRFGHHAAGDTALLRELCGSCGIEVYVSPLDEWQDAPISSTRIRALLRRGDISEVNALLTQPYALCQPAQLLPADGGMLLSQEYPVQMQVPAGGLYATAVKCGGVWAPAVSAVEENRCLTFCSPACAPDSGPEVRFEAFLGALPQGRPADILRAQLRVR